MPLVNIKPGDASKPQEPVPSNWRRTLEFWTRASGIYLAYKVAQLRAANLRLLGWQEANIQATLWTPHHEWTGDEMYKLCVDLRGFYLKVGQFLGARGDFIPMPICQRLCRLHDQVPPMPPAQTRAVIEAELGGRPLGSVFEWINAQPLGAASISQVHKAELHRDLRVKGRPRNRIVAVKVQYPNALPLMMADLVNIRPAAAFLQKTELAFDLVSVVDELAGQIRLEFDFRREARVMDTINAQLQDLRGTVQVPQSIPGLVTERLLVMTYLDGEQITRVQASSYELTRKQKQAAARIMLSRVSEAYGRMLLLSGLFQADCHPGNILVMKHGRIGLIDYGQSKQLSEEARLRFAKLILAMADGTQAQISAAVTELGIETAAGSDALRCEMAYNMFDTTGRVDPFDENSPLKKMAIEKFPGDFFFVLRVVQLLRGLANRMDIEDFSTVSQWRPFAAQALFGPEAAPAIPRKADALLSDWVWPGGVVAGGRILAQYFQLWYQDLTKPAWAPSRNMLGPLWTGLYSCLGAAATLAWHRSRSAAPFLAVLGLVALQLPAAPLMVRYASPLLAAAYSSLELVAAALVARMMYKVRPLAGYLMLLYCAWNAFTTLLNLRIWRLEADPPLSPAIPALATPAASSSGVTSRPTQAARTAGLPQPATPSRSSSKGSMVASSNGAGRTMSVQPQTSTKPARQVVQTPATVRHSQNGNGAGPHGSAAPLTPATSYASDNGVVHATEQHIGMNGARSSSINCASPSSNGAGPSMHSAEQRATQEAPDLYGYDSRGTRMESSNGTSRSNSSSNGNGASLTGKQQGSLHGMPGSRRRVDTRALWRPCLVQRREVHRQPRGVLLRQPRLPARAGLTPLCAATVSH